MKKILIIVAGVLGLYLVYNLLIKKSPTAATVGTNTGTAGPLSNIFPGLFGGAVNNQTVDNTGQLIAAGGSAFTNLVGTIAPLFNTGSTYSNSMQGYTPDMTWTVPYSGLSYGGTSTATSAPSTSGSFYTPLSL